MTNIVVALIALGFVVAKVLGQPDAEKSEAGFCKHNEYPRSVEVGEYGEIKFMCEKLPRGCVNVQPKCNQIFFELSCKEHQWVGGVAGSSNLNNLVPLQCCEVPQVQSGRRLGVTKIRPRERFVGQEKKDAKDNLVSFDVITNVQKVTEKQNDYALEVHSVRMNCKGKGPSLDTAQLADTDFQFDQNPNNQGFGNQYGNDNNFGEPREYIEVIEEAPAPQQYIPPQAPPLPYQPLGLPAAPYPGLGAGGFGGGGGGGLCFSADVQAETPSGPKRMDEIKIGDQVLTLENGIVGYSPVTSFIHRLPEQKAEFLQINTIDGNSVTLTPQHFIHKISCTGASMEATMVFAKDVRAGDCLVKVEKHKDLNTRVPVREIKTVEDVGAYAPLTKNGNIIVNNLLASCHAVYNNKNMLDIVAEYTSRMKSMVADLFNINLNADKVELPWMVQFGMDYFDHIFLNGIAK